MQLNPINNSFYQINKPSVSFGAAKVHLWFDSDGTYFPDADQNVLKPERRNSEIFHKVKNAFENLNRFIKQAKNHIELNITTGRNRGEYRHYLQLLKQAGLEWVVPERLVIKNGGDVFLKTPDNDKNKLSNNAGWPSLNYIDQVKRTEIEKLSGWNGSYVKSVAIEALEEWDFPVFVSPSGNADYGSKSYLHFWNLVKEKFNDPWTAFVRQDGNLNCYIGLPPNGAANKLIHTIVETIKEKLNAKKISYDIEVKKSDWENSNGPSITITPKLNNKPLDKVYDVRKAITKAQKENDLVIIAGNGSNDRTMLNPETYTELGNIEDLPMMSIVVGNEPSLLEIAKDYPEKVIVVGQYGLLEGVKKAIRTYAKKHPVFKKNLDPSILKELY